jgi:hypothetical protein
MKMYNFLISRFTVPPCPTATVFKTGPRTGTRLFLGRCLLPSLFWRHIHGIIFRLRCTNVFLLQPTNSRSPFLKRQTILSPLLQPNSNLVYANQCCSWSAHLCYINRNPGETRTKLGELFHFLSSTYVTPNMVSIEDYSNAIPPNDRQFLIQVIFFMFSI